MIKCPLALSLTHPSSTHHHQKTNKKQLTQQPNIKQSKKKKDAKLECQVKLQTHKDPRKLKFRLTQNFVATGGKVNFRLQTQHLTAQHLNAMSN